MLQVHLSADIFLLADMSVACHHVDNHFLINVDFLL